ncbi:hypothetical protein FRB96_000345 [Tulasnella sp. 330]|nr:hypothetical protein FRB96_000345 [Tulasnella sp. 330]KAG8885025.1 hypothetical protein FRB97_002532 [Tulasnella sp. 331]KAG8890902.1 hypothetical protein FRB98_002922 [Tulasnella sp. 332]
MTSVGDFKERVSMPYDKPFVPGKLGEVIVGTVTSIKDGVACLCDYLVLSTKLAWKEPPALPPERENVCERVIEWHFELSDTNSVILLLRHAGKQAT